MADFGVGEAAAAEGAKGAGEATAATAAGVGAGEAATVLPEVVVSATPLAAEGGGAALGAGAAAGTAGATMLAEGASSDGTMSDASPAAAGSVDTGEAALADPTADIGLPADAGISYPGGGGGGYGDELADPTANIGDTSSLSTGGEDGVLDKLRTVSNSKTVKDAMDKLTKYGPLGLGAAGMLQQRSAAERFRQQMAQIGGPQRAIGEQLLGQYQSGSLNPGDAARIAEWEQSAIAQAKQYFARSGQAKGTSANTTYNQIRGQAEAMRQQALKGMLTTGLSTLNVTDRYQAAALQAEMEADRTAAQSGMNFLNAYGSWLRAVPQITGEKSTATTP